MVLTFPLGHIILRLERINHSLCGFGYGSNDGINVTRRSCNRGPVLPQEIAIFVAFPGCFCLARLPFGIAFADLPSKCANMLRGLVL
jgi:hypothetical protein